MLKLLVFKTINIEIYLIRQTYSKGTGAKQTLLSLHGGSLLFTPKIPLRENVHSELKTTETSGERLRQILISRKDKTLSFRSFISLIPIFGKQMVIIYRKITA